MLSLPAIDAAAVVGVVVGVVVDDSVVVTDVDVDVVLGLVKNIDG